MTILQINNSYSRVITENENLRLTLWRLMRYREKGYFHTALYKQKKWDGYRDFFSRSTGKFLTGLLPEVQATLDHLKEPYETVDQRIPFKWSMREINEDFLKLWGYPFELYDYQVDLVNQILKHDRGIIQAPTASGKTSVMISILKCLPQNTPTLIMANRKSLCDQNYDETTKLGFSNVGRLYDKYNEPNMMTCCTWQSVKKMAHVLPKIRCLIVDEIHEMLSKGPKKIYNSLPNCHVRVAVSATPFKFGGDDKCQKYGVKGYFGPIMKSQSAGGVLTTDKLKKRNILSQSRCIFYPIRHPELHHAIYQDAVTQGIAENFEFHKLVTKLTKSLTGRTLILVDRLDHGDYLNDLLPGSLWVRGQDNLKTRKHVIEQLKICNGNVVGIATQGIFNAGINVYIGNLINCAGGQAEHQIIQRIGRGLRIADDKEILNYYDFVFHINDYLLDHSRKRIKILAAEGHEVIVKQEIDF
jgi:superfamily II DNA or RNA helicase